MPLGSPWDQHEIRLLRDDGTHLIDRVAVLAPPDDDSDDRFALQFESAGRILRVRLPISEMVRLGELLLHLAQAQRHVGSYDDGGGDDETSDQDRDG
jgi:hypothetical protein